MARLDGTATFASVEIELVAAEAGTQEITTDQPGDCPFCHSQIAVGDEAIQCRACGSVADSLYCLGAGGERCLGCYHRLEG